MSDTSEPIVCRRCVVRYPDRLWNNPCDCVRAIVDLLHEARAENKRLHGHIRNVWQSLDEAPPPGWITQDMRDAIVTACEELNPRPWDTKEGDHE